jgi:NADPH:quinone reductase-like Zn-dependent oxidoreductase
MSWVTLTASDLMSTLTKRERDDFGKTSPETTGGDRVPQILADLVAEVRGYIATVNQNTLSTDATLIPGSMRAQALAVGRWRVLVTIPGYAPGDARKAEYEAAQKYFAMVASGKIRPEAAEDSRVPEVAQERAAGIEIVSAPGSRTGRARMNGL